MTDATTELQLTSCDECGDPDCMPCFDRDEDGDHPGTLRHRWLCDKHALKLGYCILCGQHEKSALEDKRGICRVCEADLELDDED